MTDQDALLARLDERTRHIMLRIDELTEQLQRNCVNRTEFEPVRRLVYGAVALVLAAVLGGMMAIAM